MTQVLRATFEAVFSAQEQLRKHLDTLSKENRPIQTEDERDLLFREFAYSTLGLGVDTEINFKGESGALLIRNDLETFGRWLFYQHDKFVSVPITLFRSENRAELVEIKYLWETLRKNLFTVFPIALKCAVSMSKETEGGRKASGYKVKEEKNNV